MVGKPNLPSDAEQRRYLKGSSVNRYISPLDQERAASMADEGGVSGAFTEGVLPEAARAPEPAVSRPSFAATCGKAFGASLRALKQAVTLRREGRRLGARRGRG
jgi:hypothetical protein